MPHFFLPTSTEEIALFYSDGKSLQEHPGTRRSRGKFARTLSTYAAETATWVHVGYDDNTHFGLKQGVARTVQVWESRPQTECELRREFVVDPSADGEIEAIALKDNALFIAGKFADSSLLMFDLETHEQRAIYAPFHEDLSHPRARWTQLCIHGERLFALSTFAFPSGVFEFEVSNPRRPEFVLSVSMQRQFAYDAMIEMCVGSTVLALATRNSGGEMARHRLSLFNRETLTPRHTWTTHLGDFRDGGGDHWNKINAKFIRTIDVQDERLLQASGTAGVSLFDLRLLDSERDPWGAAAVVAKRSTRIVRPGTTALTARFVSPTVVVVSWQMADNTVISELITTDSEHWT